MNYSLDGFTDEELLDALLGARRTVRFRYELLSRDLAYITDLPGVKDCSIRFDSTAAVMRTARISAVDYGIDLFEYCLRPVMELDVGGRWASWPLGVFELSTPTRREEDGAVVASIEAYDLSVRLKTRSLGKREYFPIGSTYTQGIYSMLQDMGISEPWVSQSSVTLPEDTEFAEYEKSLSAINTMLSAINYAPLFVDATGVFTALPEPKIGLENVSFEYITDKRSIIKPGASITNDCYSVPNRFVAVYSSPDTGDWIETWENNDPDDPLSTVNRGIISQELEVYDIASREELRDYVERYGREHSLSTETMEFQTALMPGHGYHDLYRVKHDALRIDGYFLEQSWEMDLRAGGTMKHTAKRV